MLTDLDPAATVGVPQRPRDPTDFDAFWRSTLDATRAHDLDLRVAPVATDCVTLDVFDVDVRRLRRRTRSAPGCALPKGVDGPLPAVVQFHGYGATGAARRSRSCCGRPPGTHTCSSTCAARAASTRAAVPPRTRSAAGPPPGLPDQGHRGPRELLLPQGVHRRGPRGRRRACAAAWTRHASRVVGNSQGGGIALAIAGLADIAALHVQAPFLCDIRRAAMITATGPYTRDRRATWPRAGPRCGGCSDTLAYFDGVGFARRATAPAWFSAGLMDDLCPPSTAFGAYHAYAGPRHIRRGSYNGHEAGGTGGPGDRADAVPRTAQTGGTTMKIAAAGHECRGRRGARAGVRCSSSDDAAGTTVNWWTWDDKQAAAYQSCADAFHKANPDLTVKITQFDGRGLLHQADRRVRRG